MPQWIGMMKTMRERRIQFGVSETAPDSNDSKRFYGTMNKISRQFLPNEQDKVKDIINNITMNKIRIQFLPIKR
jgi:hypothetical protein